ncbi:SRPBCC family protein [Pontibacter sp. KCTC 32443]|nr:SRPBCC family protein [Pontibacter sp. KCTC 32443]MBC5774664.1 SRPBCC family protein [Pontibacter sp. KCTC 32443]
METVNKTAITVETTVNAPVSKVWEYWTEPAHITKWNQASDDWHAPYAENDLKTGGKFKTTMAAKDGSMSFDFEGVYTLVKELEALEYTIADGRKVSITFTNKGNETAIVETFEAEDTFPVDMQKSGWQAILDNFKKYVEAN